MFKSITIEGLRGITQVSVKDFGRVNLIVGKNNCGKTTLLEALFFSLAPTNIKLIVNANVFRSLAHINSHIWSSYFNKNENRKKIVIESELNYPEEQRKLIITPYTKALISSVKGEDSSDLEASAAQHSTSSTVREILGLVSEFTTRKTKKNHKQTYKSKVFIKKDGVDVELPQNYEETRNGVLMSGSIISGDLPLRLERIQIQKEAERIVAILRRIEPSLLSLSLGTGGIIYCDTGLDTLLPNQLYGKWTAQAALLCPVTL